MSENKKYDFDFPEKPAKEYWTIRIKIALKDRLYDIADEMGCDIGEALNRCVECGIRHKGEWAKPKGEK